MMSWVGRGVASTVLLYTLLTLLEGARSHQITRRQLPLPSGISFGCISAFLNLDESDRSCLFSLGENLNFVNGTIAIEFAPYQLDVACADPSCQRALVTLIEACENEVRSAFELPPIVDLHELLELLCVKDDNSGAYCYYELERPLLEDDHDPLLLCNLMSSSSSEVSCADECRNALSRYQSTCCLVTYLFLVAGDSAELQKVATSAIWESCGLTAPSLCSRVDSNPQANVDDGDDNKSNAGIIVAAVMGGLIVILLTAILVVNVTYLLFKYRARSYPVNGRKDEMAVQFANHEHNDAMTM